MRSLRMKMVMIMVILILALMLTTGAFLMSGVGNFYVSQFYEQMEGTFTPEFIAQLQRLSAEDNAPAQMKELLMAQAGLGIDITGRNVYILDQTGSVLDSSNQRTTVVMTQNILSAMNGEVGQSSSVTNDYMDLAVPVESDGAQYIAYIRDNRATVDALTSELLIIILRALALGLVICVILSFLLSQILITPIRALTVGTKRVAAGDFANRVTVDSRDEIGDLTRNFNHMAKVLQDTISEAENEIVLEDLIERHNAVITLTHAGYIKRQPEDTYSAQRRGGKGIIGMATKEEDYIERVVVADSHSYILFFTTRGRVHAVKAYRIPEAGRTAKGSNIVNLLEGLEPEEAISAMLSVKGLETGEGLENQYIVMVTKRGVIKRTALAEFVMQRRGGKIALSLDDDDELVFAALTHGNSDVMIAMRDGKAVRFREDTVREMGRTARGVKGVSLAEGDSVAGACIVENDPDWMAAHQLLTITEKGFGKRTDPSLFETRGRGTKGMICHNITERTGRLCGIAVVDDDCDILLITDDGTMIRTPADGISTFGRAASGVIVMRVAEGSSIANFAVTGKAKEEEADADTETDTDTEEADTEIVEAEASNDNDTDTEE